MRLCFLLEKEISGHLTYKVVSFFVSCFSASFIGVSVKIAFCLFFLTLLVVCRRPAFGDGLTCSGDRLVSLSCRAHASFYSMLLKCVKKT
jgi:hypothetical protein